jgi:hypothetical protein
MVRNPAAGQCVSHVVVLTSRSYRGTSTEEEGHMVALIEIRTHYLCKVLKRKPKLGNYFRHPGILLAADEKSFKVPKREVFQSTEARKDEPSGCGRSKYSIIFVTACNYMHGGNVYTVAVNIRYVPVPSQDFTASCPTTGEDVVPAH